MAKQNEHGRLIAAAAKAALAPLGCKRKGKSRLWYSDQGFWIISIEFQPSGWAKGSYLNVGANWLWYPKSGWGFSEDARVEDIGFIKFENAGQFTPLIADMAARAAQEVLMRRQKYRSLEEIYRHLLPVPPAMAHQSITQRSPPDYWATWRRRISFSSAWGLGTPTATTGPKKSRPTAQHWPSSAMTPSSFGLRS